MPRKLKPVITEIIETIDCVLTATSGKSLDDFKGDWLLRLAIQRALEIISEASRHLPDDLVAPEPDIPWKQIRGIGNVLRHEYHRIADDIVWTVVANNLGQLREAALRLLARAED
jgi:uncharacterized protein with HEPN domain